MSKDGKKAGLKDVELDKEMQKEKDAGDKLLNEAAKIVAEKPSGMKVGGESCGCAPTQKVDTVNTQSVQMPRGKRKIRMFDDR